ncbi:hypothetical protein ACLB0R_05585 [Sphingomonas sp. GlSt437]
MPTRSRELHRVIHGCLNAFTPGDWVGRYQRPEMDRQLPDRFWDLAC